MLNLDFTEEQDMLREMVRGLLGQYASNEQVRAMEDDPVGYSTDLWAHGMLTMALLDVWRVARTQGDEYVSDIFRKFTFVPAVDNFLYSGQATFAAAYFRGSDDVMPVRVHPLFFSHELPTGRRLHEKLDDIMTPSQRALGGRVRVDGGCPGVASVTTA